MAAAISSVSEDKSYVPSAPAKGRKGGSWRRDIWVDEGKTGTIVAVWKAEPGVYAYPARALDETFVICEGEAVCTLDGGNPQTIGPGSIVHIPQGATITLEVLTPLRKVATVVPRA